MEGMGTAGCGWSRAQNLEGGKEGEFPSKQIGCSDRCGEYSDEEPGRNPGRWLS